MTAPAFAVVFPGQGSQSVGMLKALYAEHEAVRSTLAEASEVMGEDLCPRLWEGPKAWLDTTTNTQPVLLAAAVAVWRALIAAGMPAPRALAGHSLGEYTALVAADCLDFADALRLVSLRAQLMQAAVPEGTGGMIALIGLDDAAAAAACAQYTGEGLLAPANFNCPGQVVVAGNTPALEWLMVNAKGLGARMAMRVGMSVPSHCALLREAADALAAALDKVTLKAPRVPVWHNVDAAPADGVDGIRTRLAAQLYSPVQWTRTVQALQASGVQTYLETGPGKVLCGLVKRIDANASLLSADEPAGFAAALAALQ